MKSTNSESPGLTGLGKIVILAFIGACAAGAWKLLHPSDSKDSSASGGGKNVTSADGKTTVKIAYGTEKKRWLTWAVEEFSRTPAGASINIELAPYGSLDGARASTDLKQAITVWSPASSAFKDVYVQEWQLQHNTPAFTREEPLALSPIVLVFWKERYDAFLKKYNTVSFDAIAEAAQEPGGWQGIAGKSDWGFFKYGHTDPTNSNSGLMALILYAQHFQKKTSPLVMADVVNTEFNTWLAKMAKGLSGMGRSTGDQMKDMVLKGPASYDCLLVYENVAIDYLKNAEGRWGQLQIAYPEINIWSDNPYYVLNTPWVSAEQTKAANKFLDFLLSQRAQEQALQHGFRPAEPNVPIKAPNSPFQQYAAQGLRVEIPKVCDAPKPEAIINLLSGWQRARQ